MNFVETAPSMMCMNREAIEPAMAEPSAPAAAPTKAAGTCGKTVGLSFVLTVAVFSFTMSGLISATNWVTDHLVIPAMYEQQKAELANTTLVSASLE